jgi:hypothetical protein
MDFTKKNTCGLDLYGSGQRSAGPAQIIGCGAQGRHPIRLSDRARPSAEAGAEGVRANPSRSIKSRSTAGGRLLRAGRPELDGTLGRPGGSGGASGGPPQRRRAVEATRRSTATSAVGGNGGLIPGRKTCMAVVDELAQVLQRVSVPVFLGQGKGRVS